ncbi:hypothetical protein B0H13DRAFT_1879670 [Mycena leptocephala]|nr:hypothetical protein B0H13DRAFT_1879670 [Mycena leptocephala]
MGKPSLLSLSHIALHGALPDINAEYLELQLSLMLDITEQAGALGRQHLLTCFLHHLRILGTDKGILQMWRAIFGSINSSPATGKFQFHPNPMLRADSNDRTDDSETEVEGKKDVWQTKGIPLWQLTPLWRSRTHASFFAFAAASVGHDSQVPFEVTSDALVVPHHRALAASSDFHFRESGTLLGAKPEEMNEGDAGGGEVSGDSDTEGEVVAEGNPTGEALGVTADWWLGRVGTQKSASLLCSWSLLCVSACAVSPAFGA